MGGGAMTALDNSSTQDIDALLAEADSLMNDMDASLGGTESDAPGQDIGSAQGESNDLVATASAPADQAAVRTPSGEAVSNEEQPISDIVEGLSSFADEVDHGAVSKCLDANGSETAISGQPATPVNLPADGPTPAPQEWVNEAELGQDTGTAAENVPSIPEERSGPAPAVVAVARRAKAGGERDGLVGPVGKALHLPIDILILLDYPFARLGPNVKAGIGGAAVATLLVAIGTWIVASLHH